jgi:hypothetical protein
MYIYTMNTSQQTREMLSSDVSSRIAELMDKIKTGDLRSMIHLAI